MSMPAGLSNPEVAASLEDWVDVLSSEESPNTPNEPESTPELDAKSAEDNEEVEPDEADGEEPIAALQDGEEPTEDEGAEDGDAISSLGALAEYFEVEEDQVLDNLEVEGADGTSIPIGQALQSWRDGEGLLESRRAALETDYQGRIESVNLQADKGMAEIQTLAVALANHLRDEYSDEKLQHARMEDPDQYANLIDKRMEIMRVIEGAANSYETNAKQRESQSQGDMRQLMQTENAALMAKKPEWQDRTVRNQDMIAGQRLLLQIGFDQSEIDQVVDHKILILTDLAVKGARLSKGASGKNLDALRKKGLKKPSLGLRTKSRRDPENPTTKARDQARARLGQSGSIRDAARLVEDLI